MRPSTFLTLLELVSPSITERTRNFRKTVVPKRTTFDYIEISTHPLMDSEYQRDGCLMDMIDEKWRTDQLPKEDIWVPMAARPEPEQDNGPSAESLQEQEQKWLDLALSSLNGMPPTSTQS